MRVSRDSDPASGHEPCPKPLPNPNPNPNPRLTRFATSEGLNPSPLAGRRGRSNEKRLRIYATDPHPHPDQPIPQPSCSFPYCGSSGGVSSALGQMLISHLPAMHSLCAQLVVPSEQT